MAVKAVSTPVLVLPNLPESTSEKEFWVEELPQMIKRSKWLFLILFSACVALFFSKVASSTALIMNTKGDPTWLGISIVSIITYLGILALQLRACFLLSKFAVMEVNQGYYLYFWTIWIGFIGTIVDSVLMLGASKLFDGPWMLLFPIFETPVLLLCLYILELHVPDLEEALMENYKIERILGKGKLTASEEQYLEAHRPGFFVSFSNKYDSIKSQEQIDREKEQREKLPPLRSSSNHPRHR